MGGLTRDNSATSDADSVDVSRFCRMLDDHRTTTAEWRKQSLIDRDYRDGDQLTEWQRSVLRGRLQPDITLNHVRRGVSGMAGVVEQGKTDPRAYMRNPPEDQPSQPAQPGQPEPATKPLDAGDIASMSLRFSCDKMDYPTIKRDGTENFLVEGTCAAIFEVDQGRDNDVIGNLVAWEEFFFDPRSRKRDFSDARYMGVYKWQYADFVAKQHPKQAEEVISFAKSGGGINGGKADFSWEDRPDDADPWIDSKQQRLVIVEMYYIEGGEWLRCKFYGGGILDAPAPSPYTDDNGAAICPIIAQTCYINRKNWRFGVVRDMRGPQDEINARRSKAIHEINTRQIQQVDANAMPINADLARKEASMPGGIIPPGWQVVPRQDVIANNITMLQEAIGEIERFGPNPAILGRQSADASGRSQQVRQQAGYTELRPELASLENWEKRCYRMIWSIQRQFWKAPKWVRVTDDIGAAQYVQVNQIVGVQTVTDPQTGQPVQVPILKNEVAKMDVDIIIDTVPDSVSLEHEIWGDWVQLAGAYGPQVVPLEVMLSLSPIAKHRKIIEKLEQYRAKQAQAALTNPATQIQMAGAKADIAKTMSEVHVNQTKAQENQIHSTTAAMHGHADAQTYASGQHLMPPPGNDAGALNGSGLPQEPQGPPPG